MDTDSVVGELAPQEIRAVRAHGGATFEGNGKCVLSHFLKSIRSWTQERIRVPRGLRSALLILILLELFWVIWLATIVTGATSCRGPICAVATLDHHAAALLACGAFCIAALATLFPATLGFSKCNRAEVMALLIAASAGGLSLLGLAAVIIGALIALIILATFVLGITATPRREMDDARPRTPFPIATTRGAWSAGPYRAEHPDQAKMAQRFSASLGMDRDSSGSYGL